MAQKDIQSIADYMNELEEMQTIEDAEYDKAQEENEKFQVEDDNMIEDDDVVDFEALGFADESCNEEDDVDENDILKDKPHNGHIDVDENDDFQEAEEAFNEDVTQFTSAPEEVENDSASITVDVYNEDGFGKFFAKELMKQIPQVIAKVLNANLPNGDIRVKISGPKDELENAYAFYVGKTNFDDLSDDELEEFNSKLVFDDGDTLAEADYREAVAHCLDPIGVKASTANLVKKDCCALSLVKEEKAKRLATKMLKCLKENDFSDLTDKELDIADDINDAIVAGEGFEAMTAEEQKVWNLILAQMGFTQEEWDKLTPEKQEEVFKKHPANNPSISKTGFADYLTKIDPETGEEIKYRNEYIVDNPETGMQDKTAFNPNYTKEKSIHQNRMLKKNQDKADSEKEKEEMVKKTLKDVRGRRGTWTINEFGKIISNLDDKQRKQLMKSLIADIEAENAGNPTKVGDEIRFVKQMFGKKETLRDLAKSWNATFPAVKLFSDRVWDAIIRAALDSTADLRKPGESFETYKALGYIFNGSDARRQKFIDAFEEIMNQTPTRKDSIDPERVQKILKKRAEQNNA